jgi:hypothetical protein
MSIAFHKIFQDLSLLFYSAVLVHFDGTIYPVIKSGVKIILPGEGVQRRCLGWLDLIRLALPLPVLPGLAARAGPYPGRAAG